MNSVISDTAEYGCYLYDQACRPLLADFMAGIETDVIGKKYNTGSNQVDNVYLNQVGPVQSAPRHGHEAASRGTVLCPCCVLDVSTVGPRWRYGGASEFLPVRRAPCKGQLTYASPAGTSRGPGSGLDVDAAVAVGGHLARPACPVVSGLAVFFVSATNTRDAATLPTRLGVGVLSFSFAFFSLLRLSVWNAP